MKQCPMRFLLLACALLGAKPAWARFVMPPACKNAYTEQQEIAYGRKAAAEVYKQMPVLPDTDPVAVYVRALGARLTAYAPGYAWPYNFHVVDVADINAFALPGGSIFVNLGTIQAAENEAQLAGVMAHEISHVVMRHSTCNMTKQRKKNILFGVTQGITQVAAQVALGGVVGGTVGDMASDGIGFGQQTLYLSYSRDAEKQADLLGTDILYDAGYDPHALPQFFETIEGRYGSGTQFLNDHPNPGNRIEYVNAEIATLPPRTDNINYTPEFEDLTKKIENMHALTADEVKKGTWKKDPAFAKGPSDAPLPTTASPSAETGPQASTSTWMVLIDPDYALSYPPDWSVTDGPGQGTVTVAPKDGTMPQRDGSATVARGVMIASLPAPAGADLATDAGMDAAAAAVVKHLGLTATSAVTPIAVKGVSARSVDLQGASPVKVAGKPEIEHDWLVVFGAKDNSVRYVVFVAPEPEYLGLKPTFDAILAGFRVR